MKIALTRIMVVHPWVMELMVLLLDVMLKLE